MGVWGWGSGTGVQHKQRFGVICAERTLATQKSGLSFHPPHFLQRSVFGNPCVSSLPPPPQSPLDGSNVKADRRNCALEPGCISGTSFGNSLPRPWKVELETSVCGPPVRGAGCGARFGAKIVHSNHYAWYWAFPFGCTKWVISKVTGMSLEENTWD